MSLRVGEQIITFYFDYLCMERFLEERDNLLLVGGAMTFLLKELAGQLHACVQCSQFPLFTHSTHYMQLHRNRRCCKYCGTNEGILNNAGLTLSKRSMLTLFAQLASRKLVLFAVNNNPDCSVAEGGSHW